MSVGDVPTNLDNLVAGARPKQPVAAKIWNLLKTGWPRADLIAGILMMRQAPWGTGPAEQQHASATVVAKFHAEIGGDALAIRAFLHTLRHYIHPMEVAGSTPGQRPVSGGLPS